MKDERPTVDQQNAAANRRAIWNANEVVPQSMTKKTMEMGNRACLRMGLVDPEM